MQLHAKRCQRGWVTFHKTSSATTWYQRHFRQWKNSSCPERTPTRDLGEWAWSALLSKTVAGHSVSCYFHYTLCDVFHLWTEFFKAHMQYWRKTRWDIKLNGSFSYLLFIDDQQMVGKRLGKSCNFGFEVILQLLSRKSKLGSKYPLHSSIYCSVMSWQANCW